MADLLPPPRNHRFPLEEGIEVVLPLIQCFKAGGQRLGLSTAHIASNGVAMRISGHRTPRIQIEAMAASPSMNPLGYAFWPVDGSEAELGADYGLQGGDSNVTPSEHATGQGQTGPMQHDDRPVPANESLGVRMILFPCSTLRWRDSHS